MPNVKLTHRDGHEHYTADPGPAPQARVIVNPRSGDKWSAADILEAVQGVLAERGYALVHRPGSILLAKVGGPVMSLEARVIAEVKVIAPQELVYRDIDWTPRVLHGG